MPFRRAHIRHGLNEVVFRHQRLADPGGKLPHPIVTPDESFVLGGSNETAEDSIAALYPF
jgi:hypothetical protein